MGSDSEETRGPERPRRDAYLVSTSASDDAAYVALNDLAGILERHPGTRVVGGHMVSLIAAAFPSPGLVERRTNDADAGIPIHLATSGAIHAELVAAGYEATKGNHYEKWSDPKPYPAIDLLIPAYSGRFEPVEAGGRAFDATPGLGLVVDNERGLDIDAHMTLRRGDILESSVTVPTLESAFILKSYAWRDRHTQTPKDAIDIWNLLAVLDQHGPDAVGGWRLDTPQTAGARERAQGIARDIADWCDSRRLSASTGVDPRRMAVLLRQYVIPAES